MGEWTSCKRSQRSIALGAPWRDLHGGGWLPQDRLHLHKTCYWKWSTGCHREQSRVATSKPLEGMAAMLYLVGWWKPLQGTFTGLGV